MPYRLLGEFENLFRDKPYKHRNSSQGDFVAVQLYEDLLALDRSDKFRTRTTPPPSRVVNRDNRAHGISARRGDGTFGELIPGEEAHPEAGFSILRGRVATVEIGVEVKILSKAMIKQIDRVINDLRNQVTQFKLAGGRPICIAVIGINTAEYTVSYEGDRSYRTDGKHYPHPAQECAEAERRLRLHAADYYDEFIVLQYVATNEPPYQFRWAKAADVERDYGASLLRVLREYDSRF